MVEETSGVVEETMPEKPQTLDTLKVGLSAAIADGNDAEMMRLSKLLLKYKQDVEKAEITKLKAEAEAMAGEREKLAVSIFKALKAIVPTAELERLKAKGFTFKLDAPDSNGVMVNYKSVELLVPVIKARTGGGGGSTGALKQETGLTRHELIEKFATAEEKTAVQTAYDTAENRPDSARYNAEKPVIKRILGEHPELIKR